jgi:hypothetical protein
VDLYPIDSVVVNKIIYMKNLILSTINTCLKGLNLKVVKTSDSFIWCNTEYYLPLKVRNSNANNKLILTDYFNTDLPFVFDNEAEANFILRVFAVAIYPYNGNNI